MTDCTTKIETAIYILNNIDVKGKSNLLNLGGVVDLLEGVLKELTPKEEALVEGGR